MMTESTTETRQAAPPTSITLSIEELLIVLAALDVAAIPGLDSAAWASLSQTERELALSVARRGLVARGLAQFDDSGQLLVHRVVLTAVGVCAYPQRTAFIDHWAVPNSQPLRLYVHRQRTDCVVHEPAGGLHHFHLLASEADLADFLAATYGWTSPPAATRELRMSRDEFSRVCEASANGDQSAAVQILARANAADGVSAFVGTLAAAPRVSILQTITPTETARPEAEATFTVLQSDEDAWLIEPISSGAATPLRATRASRDRLRGTLRDVL